MKHLALLFLLAFLPAVAQAQIGYQVTLLSSATGEPRANETVSVTVSITNSENATVCSETKSATTNDFGILSLAIGNADTFADTDWTKQPFFISATVDGVMIGKSQLLSVPVAEYAKRTGELTREFLDGKRFHKKGDSDYTLSFTKEYCTRGFNDPDPRVGKYYIDGNVIVYSYTDSGYWHSEIMVYANGQIYLDGAVWE